MNTKRILALVLVMVLLTTGCATTEGGKGPGKTARKTPNDPGYVNFPLIYGVSADVDWRWFFWEFVPFVDADEKRTKRLEKLGISSEETTLRKSGPKKPISTNDWELSKR